MEKILGKQFLILLIGSTLLSISYAKDEKPLDLPACKIARVKSTYTEVFKIPDDIKSYIIVYKKSWTDFCDHKKSASIHEIFSMAKNLEEKFISIFNSRSLLPDKQNSGFDKVEEAHNYLEKVLPNFVPAFEGSILEYEYFRPKISEFKEISKYGDNEDKLFFKLLSEMLGDFMLPPWYETSWDYGGCLRFGEYDWILAYEKLIEAKKIKGAQYNKVILKQQDLLNKELEDLYFKISDKEFSKICTCKNKNDVKIDLEKLVTYLNKDKAYTSLVANLQKTLEAIKAGQIVVNSQAEKDCSR